MDGVSRERLLDRVIGSERASKRVRATAMLTQITSTEGVKM
jgi:hypothetical protein